MKTTKLSSVIPSFLLTACLAFSGAIAYAGVAGNAQFVNGSVQITNAAGQTRDLKKGDAVHESDMVTTAKNGSAQIRMLDGGLIAVRPDSKLKFDSFVFSGQIDGTEKSFFSLLKGGFRAITGLIGHKNKESYRISTAETTIGVRGTDHETFVVLPGSELATTIPVGTYNKVNVGETVMISSKGTINILPNQMGFAGGIDQMPQIQPVNTNLFTIVPPPALQGTTEVTGRASTVVDNAILEQNITPGNAVQGTPTLRPIIKENASAAPTVF